MFPLQKKGKNSFVLKFHKDLYKQEPLDRLLKEDKGWVKELKTKDKSYRHCELKNAQLKDVLEWANYLFYLNKTS
ncbi:hypothetical protein BU251_04215 [Candidatus Velamenicoccus archaeovorus]|uniref:Uncharacterized protein n=1 Tax=Velamenicoccus archaeovorus TaxID=1930593 RepID=A0A410P4E1_VELA1|nr:hypothetical protein [Candidatus Velamenicoccus archaeovorus]QAT16992.1 hypothetical protein BU251_04215 [Candidatus Velamenicoccus archaeovorus]